jgi:hypothetical protein
MNNTPAVPMNNGAVKQHHRMAAGEPCNGQTLPAPPAMPKTPA